MKMKNILIYILFLEYIKISFSLVPLWNFENSAKDLLKSSSKYEYIVSSGTLWGKEDNFDETYTFKRIIYKRNDIIMQEHQLFINDQFFWLYK